MTVGPRGEKRNHERESHALMRPVAALAERLTAISVDIAAYRWVPNRPVGLIISTIAMMMKITVFDASG